MYTIDSMRGLVGAISGFFVIARPRGGRKTGTIIYWTSVVLILLLTFLLDGLMQLTDEGQELIAKSTKEETAEDYNQPSAVIKFVLARCFIPCVSAIVTYRALVWGRRYIARHSDAQIDEHLQNYIKVGPQIARATTTTS